MAINIIRNDVTKMEGDALVNPSDIYLSGSVSIDYLVHEAAGEELSKQLQDKNIDISDVLVTESFKMANYRYIFHVAFSKYLDGNHDEERLLRKCYQNIFKEVEKNKVKSIVIPLIGTGSNNYPKSEAFKIATEEINDYALDNDLDVTLVLYDNESYLASKQLIYDVKDYLDENYHPFRKRRTEPKNYIGLVSTKSVPRYKDFKNPVYEFCYLKTNDDSAFEPDESFTEALLRIIDEKGLSDPQVYKRAGIDRKHFSKMRSDIHYHPRKNTVLSLCIALELDLETTNKMLMKAGFAFSDASKFDLIVKYAFEKKLYDINEVNNLLLEYDQEVLY